MPRTGDCSESGEVPPRSFPGCPVSRGSGGLAVFPGFSIAGTSRQAAVNSQRISLLRRSSCEYLALAARHSVLSLPSRSWWPPPGEVSPAVSPPGLGSGRPVSQDSLDSSLPPGSSVVARLAPSVSRGVSGSGVSGSGLLVRRLGRGLGSSSRLSHRFRPLGCRARCSVHQRSGASGHQGGSPPLQLFSGREECGGVLRQLHSRVVSPQGGGHKVAVPQLPGSGNSPLGGVPLHHAATSVHSGVPERSGGLSLSPSPTSSYRVVSSSRGLSVYRSHVASPNRLLCHLSKLPMLHLFLSVQGSVGSGHRRLPPTLGRASGLLVSSVVCHPSGSGEAQVVSGDGTHPDSSLLASANLVCRSPSPVAGPSGGSASTSRPPAPASVSRALPGSPQASSSCLETLRRFTRAAGFSCTVASQASLSRRPSSRKAYQLKWQVYRAWCHSHGHSVSRPTLSKVADFLCWLRSAKNLGISSIRGYRSMSAVFRFQLPSLSSHPVLQHLLRSFCLESAERQLRPPAWDLSLVLRFLDTSPFEPLSAAPLRALTQKVLFPLALATVKRVGELQALSSVVTFVHGDACLSYVPQFVAKSESLTRSIPRSLLVKSLSDFAAGLDDDLLFCPVRALRIYLDRLSSLSPLRHRLFVSPRRLTRPLSKNAVSFFLRDVIMSAGASRPEVGRVRAHDIRGISTSVAFHRNWSVSAVLESATWSCSSVFSSF